jgi:hypothetical protein
MPETCRQKYGPIPQVVLMGIAAVLIAGAAGVQAGATGQAEASPARYAFTTVLDSQRDGLEATRCPAINTLGTIAVTVRDALGDTSIITKREANDTPVTIADTRSVANSPTLCDNGFNNLPSDPSINEKGEVAFQGNLRTLSGCPSGRRQGVFLGRGGALTTIAHTINLPGGDFISEFLVADQSVNTLGRVAFVPELDLTFDHGLFVGTKNGTYDQRFLADTPTPDGFNFNNLSSRVSMNEAGQIAFESGLNNSSLGGIFLSNPDGTFRTIADNSGALSSVSDPSLNLFGRVAFLGDRFDEDFNQIFSVNTSRGGAVTTVAESSAGGFAFFSEPSLNDLNQVMFTADVQRDPNVFVTVQGVFDGPDPAANKVLQAGDRVRGVRVTSVRTCAESLNNVGQIAMIVQSEDPDTFEVRTLVVKATPN